MNAFLASDVTVTPLSAPWGTNNCKVTTGKTYHVERKLLLDLGVHHRGLELAMGIALTLERRAALHQRAALLLALVLKGLLLHFGLLPVEIDAATAVKRVRVCARAVNITKAGHELLLCLDVGLGQGAIVHKVPHVRVGADEGCGIFRVRPLWATLLMQAIQVDACAGLLCADDVLSLKVLELGVVGRLEGAWSLIFTLEFALLLVKVPGLLPGFHC